jgi:3-oxoacyl-[acyl-carrier protein] reductase
MKKVAIVTGAASGIGASTAIRLAECGWNLVLHTRSRIDSLDQVAKKCKESGANCIAISGNFSDPETSRNLVSVAVDRYAQIDALVVNAGFADTRPLAKMDEEFLKYCFDVNFYQFFQLLQQSEPWLLKSDAGRVVAISSFTAHQFNYGEGKYGFPATASAKAALEVFGKSVAVMFAKFGVTINFVVPGYIQKDFGTYSSLSSDEWEKVTASIPLGRLGSPKDVTNVVEFLLKEESSYITGQVIHVDGGFTL